MLTDREFFGLAVLLYGASSTLSFFIWRRGFRQDSRWQYILLAGAGLLHTVAMMKRGFSLERCPVNNLYEATIFSAWTIVAAYLVIGAWQRLRFLGAFVSPGLFAMGVFALMPALDVKGPRPDFSGGLVSLHVALILLAYGAFGLGSAAGVMYLTQEHDLKFHKLRALVSALPSIQGLELVIGRFLVSGVVLLAAGLALSPVLLKQAQAVNPLGDPKVLWSGFVLLLYVGLLGVHWRFSPGGRKFAWGAVGSFAFVLLTFWGFNLLSGIHNP
ncbi:MAG: cytochrome c biogenesis protein CcsA [Verrucomicrobia bacterium]|nr:cytochrome c biogenesis protein CcsA [Verrucomicrobiota bacterium]